MELMQAATQQLNEAQEKDFVSSSSCHNEDAELTP